MEIIANIIAELLVKTHNHQSYVISWVAFIMCHKYYLVFRVFFLEILSKKMHIWVVFHQPLLCEYLEVVYSDLQ